MTSRDFVFWLQGFFELREAGAAPGAPEAGMTGEQVSLLKEHLALVFKHEVGAAAAHAPNVDPEKVTEVMKRVAKGIAHPNGRGTLIC